MGPPSLASELPYSGLLRSALLFPSPLLRMADPFPARPKKPPKKSRECVVTDSETISSTTEMSGRLLRMSEGNSRELCQNKHTHSPLVLHRASNRPVGMAAINSGGRKIRPKSRINRTQSFTAFSPLPAFNKYTFTGSEKFDVASQLRKYDHA